MSGLDSNSAVRKVVSATDSAYQFAAAVLTTDTSCAVVMLQINVVKTDPMM